jgi:hypothetical protein
MIRRVKGTMVRVKTILALLIAALSLVATQTCLCDPVGGFVSERSDSSLSAHGGADHNSSVPFCSLEQSALHWARRLNVKSGSERAFIPVELFSFESPLPHGLAISQARSCGAAGLANCWQFDWRTAPEPRAPSSVS